MAKKVKSLPILLLDMDGPLADFDAKYFTYCAEAGHTLDATYETQTARFASDHIVSEEERAAATAVVNSPGWFIDLPVTVGALENFGTLMEHFEIWLVSKPLESNPTCRDEKAAWVKANLGDGWERRLILAPDKSMVIGDILLDDAPKSEWFPAALWVPVVFTRPYNVADELADLPHWAWGDPVEDLVAQVPR